MINKGTLQALLWAMAAFLGVMIIIPAILPKLSTPKPQNQTPPQTPVKPQHNPMDASQGGSPGQVTPGQSETAVDKSTVSAASGLTVAEAGEETSLVLGDDGKDSGYRMRAVVSNVGASVERVTLTDYTKDLDSDKRLELLTPVLRGDKIAFRSFAVEKINIDDADLALLDKKWHLEPLSSPDGAKAKMTLDILKDDRPIIRLTRDYFLPKQDKASMLHDFNIGLSILNLSDKEHNVIVAYRGGIGVGRLGSRRDVRAFDVGISDGEQIRAHRNQLGKLTKSAQQGLELYDTSTAKPGEKFWWAALDNQYFTCTVLPQTISLKEGAEYIRQVRAIDADGFANTLDDATLDFVLRQERLAAGAEVVYPAEVYLGPKSPRSFKDVPKYQARNYYQQVSQGFGYCTFTWLVELMMWLLNGLHFIFRDYGIALIVLVLVVRALLHPITKKGQVSMARMQKQMGTLAPKMEEIKKKYANDAMKRQEETTKLYRESGVNPAGQMLGCLPMMLQMPIWVALYMSLSSNILMRHQPFAWSWPQDLTAPDALITFAAPIHLPIYGAIHTFNLLPFILAAAMYVQQKLMPKPAPPANQTDKQKQQAETMQKMMPLMSFMMLFFFYSAPSGLTLYIMASSIFGAIEQIHIRKHIKQEEANPKRPKPHRGKITGKSDHKKTGQPARGGGGLFAKLQKMAEQAQKGRKMSKKTPGKSRR